MANGTVAMSLGSTGRGTPWRVARGVIDRPGPVVLVAVGLAYLVVAQTVVILNNPLGQGAAFWPAAGISVGALLLLPARRWPWALAGIGLAEFFGNLAHGYPVVNCGWWAAGNIAEPLVAALIVRRLTADERYLVPARNCVAFVVGAVLIAPIVGASLGALGSTPSNKPYWFIWTKWIVGDGLGVLVVAPVMLSIRERWSPRSVAEQLALLAGLIATPLVIFRTWDHTWEVSLPYLGIPLLTWAALRHGVRTTAWAIALMTQVANWATVYGYGPFATGEDPGGSHIVTSLQVFLAITSATALILAALVADLVDRSVVERALQHQAYHDALTGLPNRAYLNALLAGNGQGRQDGPGGHDGHGDPASAVFVCDVDNFKLVNDTLGHHAGDEYLVEIVTRMRSCLRPDDTLVRLSGDEFVALIAGAPASAVDDLAERMLAAVHEPLRLGGTTIRPSISIGIASSDGDDGLDAMLRAADAALYDVKSSGRGQARRADPGVRAMALERMRFESEVGAALESGQIDFVYQPEVEIASGRLFCAEALARWQHPSVGLVGPSHFLPAVRATGNSRALFEAALANALRVQSEWTRRLGTRPPVAINLSAADLGDRGLVDVVAGAVELAGGDPGSLWLEVTESDAAAPSAVATLTALSGLGLQLAVDDFGKGWSSLDRLAGGPWNALKIDRSLVATVDTSPSAAHVVRTIVGLAHSLGLQAVAEGVETQAQLRCVVDLGCDVVQGYLVGRPTAPASLVDSLDSRLAWSGLTDRVRHGPLATHRESRPPEALTDRV